MGREGTPEEVAKAAVFLASEDSSYITAAELFVGRRKGSGVDSGSGGIRNRLPTPFFKSQFRAFVRKSYTFF
jgi:hypothetical protein